MRNNDLNQIIQNTTINLINTFGENNTNANTNFNNQTNTPTHTLSDAEVSARALEIMFGLVALVVLSLALSACLNKKACLLNKNWFSTFRNTLRNRNSDENNSLLEQGTSNQNGDEGSEQTAPAGTFK